MKTKIVLVVATQLELKIANKEISILSQVKPVLGNLSYLEAELDSAIVYIVKCQMGQMDVILTLDEAIRRFEPDFVIMGGIAWGGNEKEQKIGDVLVSTLVWDYDKGKINPDGSFTPRGTTSPSSPRLVRMFEVVSVSIKDYKLNFGLVASGSYLLNNEDYVNRLKEMQPELIGGDMESAGMASVCFYKKIDWILVKGICDWGYDKDSDKKKNQELAAANSFAAISSFLTQFVGKPVDAKEHTSSAETILPVFHKFPDRNIHFTGRDSALEEIHLQLQTGRMVSIVGKGGVGKTHTAIEYAYRYKNDYKDILWVNANSVHDEYRAIAQSMDLSSDDSVDWSVVLNEVKRWFDQHDNFLLIFDNVEDFEQLEDCLPRFSGHVLITTRVVNSTWKKSEYLNMFLPGEATKFLEMRLDRDEGEDARNLAERLSYHPLALAQAAAFMLENRETCKGYLKRLDEEGLDVFEEKDARDYRYTAALNANLQISYEKIELESAKQLFNLCAYMAPDNIPLSLFIEGLETLPEELRKDLGGQESYNNAVSELISYSLAKRYNDFLSIHPLVQELMREKLSKDEDMQWLHFCLNMASSVFKYEYGNNKLMEAFTQNVQHILSIADHAEKMPDNEKGTKEKIALIYKNAGLGFYHNGKYKEAFECYQKALTIQEEVLGPEHPDTAKTYNDIAGVYFNRGEFEEAKKWHQKSLSIRKKKLEKEYFSIATSFNNIAGACRDQGNYEEALVLYNKALENCEKVSEKKHQFIFDIYNNMGLLYNFLGNYEKAMELHEMARIICENEFTTEHPYTARTYNNIGHIHYNQGNYEKALLWYQKALDIREKVLGKENLDTVRTYNNIGFIYSLLGNYEETLLWYHKALATKEKVLGPEHPDTARTYYNIGLVYYLLCNYEEALLWYQKALGIREKVLGPEHPDTARAYNSIGLVYSSQDNYEEALELFNEALNIIEKVLGPEHPDTARTYNNIGLIYTYQGNNKEALELFHKALNITEKILGKEHLDTARTYNNIGLVYSNQGNYKESILWYANALIIRKKALGKEHPDTDDTINSIVNVCNIMTQHKEDENLQKEAESDVKPKERLVQKIGESVQQIQIINVTNNLDISEDRMRVIMEQLVSRNANSKKRAIEKEVVETLADSEPQIHAQKTEAVEEKRTIDINKGNSDQQRLVLSFSPIDLKHNDSLSDVIIVNAQPDLSRLPLERVPDSSLKRVGQSTELESFINETFKLAKDKNANLVVFPELCVPEKYHNLFSEWAKVNNNSILIAGSDYFCEDGNLYNRASIFYNDKQFYTEKFRPSSQENGITCRDAHQFFLSKTPIGNVGIAICSDIFQRGRDEYAPGQDIFTELTKKKLDILVVIACQDKPDEHLNIINTFIEETSDRMLCIYCNFCGKIAKGRSAILAKDYKEGHDDSVNRKLVMKDGLSTNQIEMSNSGGVLVAKYKISKAPPTIGNRDPARRLFTVKEIYEYISGEFHLKTNDTDFGDN